MTEGQVIYHLWISEAEEYIDWIFHPIAPPAGHVLVFDVWVHPDHRGGNVHWAGAAEACAEAVRRHRPVIFAGILTIDIVVFAKAKAI
jgi:hypothetical protein